MDDNEVYVNCLKIASSLTKYRDNTYLEYDMQTQIHFHKQGYIDLIMKYAKRLTKEEFIEKAKEHFNRMRDDLEKSLTDWNN